MKKAGAADLSRLRAALDAFAAGDCVVLYDDAHPEVGGYVCCPGNAIDDRKINFMVTHARGHVCVTMNEARMRAFGIPLLAISGFAVIATLMLVIHKIMPMLTVSLKVVDITPSHIGLLGTHSDFRKALPSR